MIRIRKGGREFTATRMEIVRELARRGLLTAEDPVSINDAPFVAAAEIPEIAECLQDRPDAPTITGDPWHHWSSTSLDSGEWETEADGVLSSFLDVVTASSMPTLQALLEGREAEGAAPIEALSSDSELQKRHQDPDAFPPSLSAVSPVTAPTEDNLPAIPAADEAPTVTDTIWPGAAESDGDSDGDSDDPSAEAPPVPMEEAGAEGKDSGDLPVSFTEWLDNRGQPDSAGSLVALGGRAEGLSASATAPPRGDFSLWRVVLILSIGVVLVGGYRLYVRTGALSEFPTESQLQHRGAAGAAASATGDGTADKKPAPPTEPAPLESPDDPRMDRHKRVLRIRNHIKGNIVPFSSAEMLENSLFQEFLNLGAQPSSVTVEALRVKGSLDKDSRRPVLANLEIEFQGVEGEDSDQRMVRFEDRLLTAWLVLGKYATLGKVTLGEARISVREPTPWDESYEGRDLAGLWTGTIPAEELFPR